jgi:hypothetical protein
VSQITRTSTILRMRLGNLTAAYMQAIKAAERDEWRARQRKSRANRRARVCEGNK